VIHYTIPSWWALWHIVRVIVLPVHCASASFVRAVGSYSVNTEMSSRSWKRLGLRDDGWGSALVRISVVISRLRHLVSGDCLFLNRFSHKMILDINILRMSMEFSISSQCNDPLVVHIDIPCFLLVKSKAL